MSKDKLILRVGGCKWDVWRNFKKNDNRTAFSQKEEVVYESRSKHLFWRGPVHIWQVVLVILTVVHLSVISVLLMVDSPKQIVANVIPSGGTIQNITQMDQTVIHFLCFCLLAVLFCLCFRKLSCFMAIVFMVAYAVFTELFQIFLPHRNSDPVDLLANFFGIGCGVAFVWGMFRMKTKT